MTSKRYNAFTLVEMMLAIAIITILLGAVEASLVLAARSIPDSRNAAACTMSGSRALDMMAQDLFYATGGTCTSSTDITITVPSRSGGSGSDTIRYYWDTSSSTKPLRRQVNGGTANIVADNVSNFSLTYDRRQVTNPTSYTNTSESLLASNDGLVLLPADGRIESSKMYGQYFKPSSLPSNAVSWAVTRVQYKGESYGTVQGSMSVQVTAENGSGVPSGSALDSVTVNETSLPASYAWQTVSFTKASGLNVSQGACVLFTWISDTDAASVQYATGLNLANSAMLSSTNGTSWSSSLTSDLLYYVYGTASIPAPTTYSYYLTNVRASVQVGNDPHSQISTNLRALNEPQVN